MKKCILCKIEQNYEMFDKNKSRFDGLQSYCKKCGREKDKRHYENSAVRKEKIRINDEIALDRNTKFIYDYLSTHPCVDCNESDVVVLEFDHVRGSKLKNVSSLVSRGFTIMAIKTEIEKCEVRCANCHRRKTAKQFDHRILKFVIPR